MKDFKKYYVINAKPDEVYRALTNPTSIRLWTGEPAVMSTEPGSEFSMWDEAIVGKNLEFVENQKIVQQWYFEGESAESIVTIILHEKGDNTSVELRHTNIPDQEYDNFVEGWDESYFAELKEFFEE